MTSAIPPNSVSPDQLLVNIEFTQAGLLRVQYAVSASLALLVYDYVLTFQDELRYIWRTPRSLGKTLFLLLRYPALLDMPLFAILSLTSFVSDAGDITTYLPVKWQMFLQLWYSWSFTLSTAVAGVVIALRTWVIWERSRAWAALLVTAYAGVFITCFSYQVVWTVSKTSTPSSAVLFSDPYYDDTMGGPGGMLTYVLMCAWEGLILLATTARGIQYLTTRNKLLTSVLYRDAVIASITLLITGSLDIVAMSATWVSGGSVGPYDDLNLSELPLWVQSPMVFVGINRTLQAVTSAHIILNLRKAVDGGMDAALGTSDTSVWV